MKPYFIGVAGPSCAGKSYLAGHLAAKLDAVLFHLDSYYRELDHLSLVQRAHYNFDSPQALDSELLLRQVRELHNGETIARPVYDFTTHTRTGETRELAPRPFVIVEGLFALHWESLRKLLGTKVFVDLGEEICLERRMERDIRERGRTRESVLEQYRTTVAPMARQYVYPARVHADIVVTGNDDIAHEVNAVLQHVAHGEHMSAGSRSAMFTEIDS
jgi:uridine kinase